MAFTGDEDHSITLQEAAELTRLYRENAGSGAILGGFFGKTALQNILNQEGCVGIRYYYGLDSEGVSHPVLVGTDAQENDLVDGLLAERDGPCPPICGDANPLNS